MALVVFAVAALVFSVSPVTTNFDSYANFPTAVSIVNRQTLSLDAYRHVPVVATNYTVGHANGHLLNFFPWPVALFATPAVVVLDLYHAVGGPSADADVAAHGRIQTLVQLWSASLVTALACAVLALLAYRRLGGSPRTRRRLALVCGLVFAFGTSAWSTASRSLWQHGPALLFLALGLLALDQLFPRGNVQPTSSPMLPSFAAGAAFLAAVAVRPTNAVALVLAAVVIAWRARRGIWAYVAGGVVIALPWFALTYDFYGRWLQPYDSANRLGLPSTFWEAIGANLISPGRGLLIFSPIVIVAGAGLAIAWRRRSIGPLEGMSVVAIVGLLIVVSTQPIWWAGSSYGPRYMSETLPFIFVLALPFVDWARAWHAQALKDRSARYRISAVIVAVLLLASVVFNAEGGLLRSSTCWTGTTGTAQSVNTRPARVWSWSDAQFDYGLRAIGTEGVHAISRCPAST
jgi:hypothetical protein